MAAPPPGTAAGAVRSGASPGTASPGSPLVDALPACGHPDGSLAGVVVLDLSAVGPASRCTRALADYGATLVKVRPVPAAGSPRPAPPGWAYGGGRSTAHVCLDVRDPGGRDAFLALAAAADVVVESFRPGVVDRLGIGHSAVAARNPGVVYCATTGYGQRGERSGWAGHDLNYLAAGGYLASTGPRADGGPPIPGATLADGAAGGLHAALAITAALVARARTGEGAYLDVAVADGVLWLMGLQADEHLATGAAPGPGHDVLTGRYACYDTYRAADGGWLAVAAIEPAFFANLCRALGLGGWADRQYDDAAQPELRRVLAEALATRRRDDWVAELAGADTCVAPVLTVAEAVAAAEAAAGDAQPPPVLHAVRPDGTPTRQVGPLLAGTVAPASPVALPDQERSATRVLLRAAGVADDTVEALVRRGVAA